MPTREGEPNPGQRPDALRNILNRRVTCRDFLKGAAIFGGLAFLGSTIDKGRLVGEVVQAAQALGRMSTEIMSGKDSIQDVLANLIVTPEWLRDHPQVIAAVESVTDQNGNVIKQYVMPGLQDYGILKLSNLYETHLDLTTNQFTKYKAISQIPMELPHAMVVSPDGNTIIAVGEHPFGTRKVSLTVSYDAGKTWENISWPWPDDFAGDSSDLLRISDTVYIGNGGRIGQFIITLNPESQTATLAQVNLKMEGADIDVGGAMDLAITSVDAANHRIKMLSTGTWNRELQSGIVLFDINYKTGEGTIENITTVTMDGVENYDLGWLNGVGQYTDAQGHLHVVTSNFVRGLLFDIDLTAKTGTSQYYADLLDDKEIPNYWKDTLTAGAIDVIVSQDKKHIWGAGAYSSTIDGGGRAIVFDFETLTYYDLEPNQPSDILDQNSMKRKTINGQSGYELTIYGLGIAFVPTRPDGSPDPDAPILFPNKGLGDPLVKHRITLPDIRK